MLICNYYNFNKRIHFAMLTLQKQGEFNLHIHGFEYP